MKLVHISLLDAKGELIGKPRPTIDTADVIPAIGARTIKPKEAGTRVDGGWNPVAVPSLGHNNKSPQQEEQQRQTRHWIMNKKNITKKINLYIVRISSVGEVMCSAPCIDCFFKMKEFNIKSLVYIGHDGDIIKRNFEDFHTTHQSSGSKAISAKRVKCI